MSENKLYEKTKKVVESQRELSSLVDDLKEEVRQVFLENKKLSDENQKLKKELTFYIQNQQEPVVEDIEEIVEDTKEIPPIEVPQVEAVVPKEPQKVQETQQRQQQQPVIHHKERKPSALSEFFLGKNIIAKIAIVLIFLGVISFGQIAYVNWLGDWGRFLLIFFTGIAVFGIGYYSEKKEAIVFSNAFYGLSVFIVYYSFLLASFQFSLFGNNVVSFLLLAEMLGVLYYFKDKRYEFLDVVLFIFYIFAGFSIVIYVREGSNFLTYIEILLFAGLFAYIVYQYLTKYLKGKTPLLAINQVIFMIAFFAFMISIFSYNPLLVGQEIAVLILYSLIGIFYLYVVNLLYDIEDQSVTKYATPLLSSVIAVLLSSTLTFLILELFDIELISLIIIFFILVLAPLYAYIYNKKQYKDLKNYYIWLIALALFIYSFVAQSFTSGSIAGFNVLNAVLAVEILLLYVLGKFTKDKVHKGISYFFVLILLFKNLLYYPFSGSLTFAESDVLFVTFGLGLVLLGINLYFKYKKQEENEYDMILVNALNLLALVPIIMTITNDLISNEAAFIMASVMALFIGYRWLIIIEPLKMKNEKHFVLGVNIGILLLTFSLNLFYFDHDFSQFKDVLKFFLLFLVNVYNVWSLREIYKGYCKTDHVERNFIILYGIGVLIHSIFIHRYINFEFDKVILSSYFLIASAVGILAGFRQGWSVTRRIGLGAIYFSLAKFFIYDFFNQDFSNFVKMVTYFILGFILLGISYLYAYLEKTYGYKEHPNTNEKKESKYSVKL